jgi:hypothetical protein
MGMAGEFRMSNDECLRSGIRQNSDRWLAALNSGEFSYETTDN